MKKVLMVVLTALLVLSLASGCANSNSEPVAKEITWARQYDASSLDPAEASDDSSISIVSFMCEGLTRCINSEIVSGIAEKWDISDDGLTYTFHLRDSKWSDGSPLTAQDFEYAFQRLIDPEQGHAQASAGYVIANAQSYAEGTADLADVGFKALDESTLEVVFQNPGLENLYILSMCQFYPVKQSVVEEAGAAYGSDQDKVMGNGPFVVSEWSHDDKVVLEKNTNYWNAGAINITKINALGNVPSDTAMEMMQTGQVDIAEYSDPTYYETLAGEGFSDTSYCNTYSFLHINHKGMSEESGRFLSNTNFRLALSYALDRTALCQSAMPGQTPASRLTDPSVMGVEGAFVGEYPLDNGLNVTADAVKAKEYLDLALQELGATIDDVPEFSMLCFESQSSQTILQACQDMFLTTLGIRCTIDPQPVQQMLGKVFTFDYDFWYGGLTSGTMDAASANGTFAYWDSSNPDALFGFDNTQFNELLKTAQTTSDMKTRKDAVFEMEKIVCAEIPSLLLCWQTQHCIYKPEIVLNGIDPSFGPDLAFADIQQE